MKYKQDGNGIYLLRLDRGDKMRKSIESFFLETKLNGASVQGIGALEDPELGYLPPDTKFFDRKLFSGSWELVSFSGNLTYKEEKPFLHAHAIISGHNYAVVGGHFFDANVSVLCELVITPFQKRINRVENHTLGIHEWDMK